MKKKSNYFILGLMVLVISLPVHAEESIFDSYSSRLKKIAEEAKKKIQDYYGYNKEDPNKNNPPVNPPIINNPVITIDPVKEKFKQCRKFLGYMYDVNYQKDSKKIATIYLNASLDYYTTSSYDVKTSDSEIEERNKCVELALVEGADPDSSGKEKRDDSSMFEPSKPLALAVKNENIKAVKLLLEYKANPNAMDIGFGKEVPLLNLAMNFSSEEIALELINAGADISSPNVLWMAASNAHDKVVELLLDKKVPVNQSVKFSSFDDEVGQTALDSSEYRLSSLSKYQKEIASNAKLSLQDKLLEANSVLYYNYPLMPQLKMKDNINPDEFINNLFTRQQAVSNLLKDAGGVCNEENCGIVNVSN